MILNMRIGSGSSDGSTPLDFVYTGEYMFNGSLTEDWTITLLTSGTLTFYSLGDNVYSADLFLVGGGANGVSGSSSTGGAGGGSGYTTTVVGKMIEKNTPYPIEIGGAGGTTSAFGYTAAGGSGQTGKRNGGGGCSGGYYDATWGWGVSTASSGSNGEYAFEDSAFNHALGAGYRFGASGGGGAGVTTGAWYGEGTSTIYGRAGAGGTSGGGGGGTHGVNGVAATANSGSGGGGGGSNASGGSGGSGVVIIRNARN